MKLRGYVSPERRPLKIFAFDPMFGRTAGNRITINVRNEPLWLGPSGSQVMVIDYDSANDCFYQPVNLNARSILIENGLDPSESAPRFHQQMVYAVTMKVIENFERALGRHFRFRGPEGKLRIFPHAFQDANAFYDPDHCAIFFGYFRADLANPGRNLPGQTVFTCLSHDIIAHETTHAIVDRLKPHFNDATNPDVFAFHEGFADIVAIFQHFSFPDMLRDVVQQTRTDLSTPTPMLELAQQFGHATGTGRALRTAREDAGIAIDTLYKTLWEPHDRGSILVAAVFDGFFETYQRRIRDLVRIATGGTGVLAQGDLHPDLVNRIANEASSTAQDVLTMCIRALEFLPPVDVTFGDFLRALVTADWELDPSDETGLRAATIEAFRRRGVFPHDVYSLAEESLRWPQATEFAGRVAPLPVAPVTDLLREAERTYGAFRRRPDSGDTEKGLRRWKKQLAAYAKKNARTLKLDRDLAIEPAGFHSTYRLSPLDGQLHIDVVVQFIQRYEPRTSAEADALGGLEVCGGTTVVASSDGTVRYLMAKPVPSAESNDRERDASFERVARFVARCDAADPRLTWSNGGYWKKRAARRINFAAVHRGLSRGPS